MTESITSESDAKNQFLDFVGALERGPHSPGHPEFGYRIDTWQLWNKCDGHHEHGCANPGLSVGIDAPALEPFVVMVGPYALCRERLVEDAYARMTREVAFYVQVSNGHQHLFGQPHHDTCDMCQEVPSQPPGSPA